MNNLFNRFPLILIMLSIALSGKALARSSNAASAKIVKAHIPKAAQKGGAEGAKEICMLLRRSAGAVASSGKIDGLRVWDEVLNDCQKAIAGMKDPAAQPVFAEVLLRSDVRSQCVLAIALASHVPNKEVDQAALKLLPRGANFQVKVACMHLLGAHQVKDAIEPILKLLSKRQLVSVQYAACRALAHLPDKKTVSGLVDALKEFKSGRVQYEITAALRAVTGLKFNHDASTWGHWWEKNAATYKAPATTDPVLNYEISPSEEEGELTYYEIPIVEDRVLFLIDVSGSMRAGGSPNRLERAKEELKKLIDGLPKKTWFNIILFSTKITRWHPGKGLIPATKVAKAAAKAFLDKAQPEQMTQTMAAMEEALWKIALSNGVETLFLLTDGVPNPMKHSGNQRKVTQRSLDDIRSRIKFINQTLKVRIHTIGIYTGAKKGKGLVPMEAFLKGIADENDGLYKKVE